MQRSADMWTAKVLLKLRGSFHLQVQIVMQTFQTNDCQIKTQTQKLTLTLQT